MSWRRPPTTVEHLRDEPGVDALGQCWPIPSTAKKSSISAAVSHQFPGGEVFVDAIPLVSEIPSMALRSCW